MDFRILGPLEVRDETGALRPLSRRMQRVLLAVLLFHAGRPVPTARLVDWLWGGRPPASATQNLHSYVSELRRGLGDETRIRSDSGGYLIRVEPGELDADVFEELADSGRRAAAEGRYEPAIEQLTRALGLWRSDAVAEGLALPDALHAQVVRLREARTAALEAVFEARLAVGRHQELVPELESAARLHPLRERLWAQLMLALYRSGRQADALAAYGQVDEALAAELGVRPGEDLRSLRERILRADPALRPAGRTGRAPAPRVPAQLPLDVSAFAGRGPQLEQLDGLLTRTGEQPTAVVISALLGTAGVGKTALAVHWAHKIADDFPDGQLYVNLRGFDADRSVADPAEVIHRFLDAFEVPPQRIPADRQAQADLYRSLLAGRRVLMVLDNARDADQVRPLLPGAPGCLVLVTSRDQLTGLLTSGAAHPITLDLLSAEEARQLLAGRLGDERLAEDPEAVEEIIERCARLPLALAIVAARAATRPRFPLRVLAEQLGDAPAGLDDFAGGDTASDIRGVFSWSYRALSPEAAKLFRMLGNHPGPDLAVATAAALAGAPPESIRPLLDELTRAHLVSEHVPGRYTFHDLLRAYARELTAAHDPEPERRTALDRVLSHYAHTADAADRLVMPGRRHAVLGPPESGSRPLRPSSSAEALRWCEEERLNLVAVTRAAAEAGRDDLAWAIPYALWSYFSVRSRWGDWFTTHEIGIAAARRGGHTYGEALLQTSIANAFRDARRYEEAFDRFDKAIALSEEIGETWVEAAARTLLGIAHRDLRMFAEAQAHCGRALEIFRSHDDAWGMAWALCTLGEICGDVGDHERAISYTHQALAHFEETDDQWGKGRALSLIGQLQRGLGRYDEATGYCRQALDIARQIGNRHGEALAVYTLGKVQHDTGQTDAARTSWQSALAILEELGAPQAARVRTRLHALDAEPRA